eukprot:scaffold2.g7449.t1
MPPPHHDSIAPKQCPCEAGPKASALGKKVLQCHLRLVPAIEGLATVGSGVCIALKALQRNGELAALPAATLAGTLRWPLAALGPCCEYVEGGAATTVGGAAMGLRSTDRVPVTVAPEQIIDLARRLGMLANLASLLLELWQGAKEPASGLLRGPAAQLLQADAGPATRRWLAETVAVGMLTLLATQGFAGHLQAWALSGRCLAALSKEPFAAEWPALLGDASPNLLLKLGQLFDRAPTPELAHQRSRACLSALLPALAALDELLQWKQRHGGSAAAAAWNPLPLRGRAQQYKEVLEKNLLDIQGCSSEAAGASSSAGTAGGDGEARWQLECERALAVRHCTNVRCPNLAAASEASLKTKLCSGCRTAHFCTVSCARAAWRAGHRQACRQLAQEREAAGREPTESEQAEPEFEDGNGGGGESCGGVTLYVLVVAIIAAVGGMLFGFDVGIVGGVEAMASWQLKFFPDIYARSSLPSYSFRAVVMSSGLLFMVGAGLQAGSVNLAMLIVGRTVLGCGVGAAAVTVPVYISEAAPFASRGGLSMLWQARALCVTCLAVTVGILAAMTRCPVHACPEWGWRLSLGLAAVPAIVLTLGTLLLPESPSSLAERGRMREARAVLELLRGTKDVDAELADVADAAYQSSHMSALQAWRAIFRRQNLPLTICGCTLAAMQQLTGINALIFYSAVLFDAFGALRTTALLHAVVVGAVNVVSTFVGILLVDRVGRRGLLLEGGTQMALAMVATAIVLGVGLGGGKDKLPTGLAAVALVFICLFISGFAWSWGPLVWVIGAEVQTLETRVAGMTAVVFFNFLFSFVVGQSFLSMLCAMKFGVFLFFTGWVILMTLFVLVLMPGACAWSRLRLMESAAAETKGVPIEDTAYLSLFARHPIWRRVMGPAAQEVGEVGEGPASASARACPARACNTARSFLSSHGA